MRSMSSIEKAINGHMQSVSNLIHQVIIHFERFILIFKVQVPSFSYNDVMHDQKEENRKIDMKMIQFII